MKRIRIVGIVLLVLALCFTAGCQKRDDDAEGGSAAGGENLIEGGGEGNPVVTIVMDGGEEIQVELYPDVAPNTVNNFIALIAEGYYDGLNFHRIDPTFMIQGGDPLGNGTGGPGYSIKGEFSSNGVANDLSHARGVISMAHSKHPDSAGSQFFIVVEDASFLDGSYAAFGEVISGMDVVDAIANAERSGETPANPRVMETVKVQTNSYSWSQPEKAS